MSEERPRRRNPDKNNKRKKRRSKPKKDEEWISLEEARQRCYGDVEWWTCEGMHGERVEVKQHHRDGPKDKPVLLYGCGDMYIGGWKKNEYHGFGAFYFQDGYVIVGYCRDSSISSIKCVWVPEAPFWKENKRPQSVIHANVARRGKKVKVGLPFIYLGSEEGDWKADDRATVILKNGVTRTGPWNLFSPVGNWWRDHEKSVTSRTEIAKLLAFATEPNVESPAVAKGYITTTNAPIAPESSRGTDRTSRTDLRDVEVITANPSIGSGSHNSFASSWHSFDSEANNTHQFTDSPKSSSDTSSPVDRPLKRRPNQVESPMSPRQISKPTKQSSASPSTQKELIPMGSLMTKSTRSREYPEDARTPDSKRVAKTVTPSPLSQRDTIDHPVSGKSPGRPPRPNSNLIQVASQPSQALRESTVKNICDFFEDIVNARPPVNPPVVEESTEKEPVVDAELYEERLTALTTWLAEEIIGFAADKVEMEAYAKRLLGCGFHSVDMIQKLCSPDDVAAFPWMKIIHKRLFINHAKLECTMRIPIRPS